MTAMPESGPRDSLVRRQPLDFVLKRGHPPFGELLPWHVFLLIPFLSSAQTLLILEGYPFNSPDSIQKPLWFDRLTMSGFFDEFTQFRSS
jgi:hypothetical protein